MGAVSLISLRLERVDNLGAYRIPPETGILIPLQQLQRSTTSMAIARKTINYTVYLPRYEPGMGVGIFVQQPEHGWRPSDWGSAPDLDGT